VSITTYVYVLAEVVFVLGLGVQGVPRVGAYFPFGTLRIVEFVGDVVVGPFGSLLSEAIDHCHFFGHELFGFCISGGGAEGKLWGRWFFALIHFSESRVNFGV